MSLGRGCMMHRTRQLLAAAAFSAIAVMVLSACAVGLTVHAVAIGWGVLFGGNGAELAGDHEKE
jgi:hypothetical protein